MSNEHELALKGWNDVVGRVKMTKSSDDQIIDYAFKLAAGEAKLSHSEPAYRSGTIDAANAILNGQELKFRGPAEMVAELDLFVRAVLAE